jgi:hypothetical protein
MKFVSDLWQVGGNFSVVHFDIGSCQARNIMANGDSHEFTGYCFDVLPFLCKGMYIT